MTGMAYFHCRTQTRDTNSYTMQDFSIGSDSDSDPMIEMYIVGTEFLFQK